MYLRKTIYQYPYDQIRRTRNYLLDCSPSPGRSKNQSITLQTNSISRVRYRRVRSRRPLDRQYSQCTIGYETRIDSSILNPEQQSTYVDLIKSRLRTYIQFLTRATSFYNLRNITTYLLQILLAFSTNRTLRPRTTRNLLLTYIEAKNILTL